MPQFKTPEEYVAFLVFKQTLTTGDVNEYQVVDRFLETAGTKIVARFDDEAEANEYRDRLREQRVAGLKATVR